VSRFLSILVLPYALAIPAAAQRPDSASLKISGRPRLLLTEGRLGEIVKLRESDPDPHHFLDPAEMTFGFAVVRDWLDSTLTEAERSTPRAAMVNAKRPPSHRRDPLPGGSASLAAPPMRPLAEGLRTCPVR